MPPTVRPERSEAKSKDAISIESNSNMVLHMTVPDQLRGRVMSIYMLDRGITPAGALMAGVSAHFIGAPYTVVGMGALVLALAAVVVVFLPSLRKVRA